MTEQETYEIIAALPPLQKHYIRAAHAYLGAEKGQSILKDGLCFNVEAAGLSPQHPGGYYNEPASMVSTFDEEGFWEHLKHDDFACFNDARYADKQIIFDIPIAEYALLSTYGRIYHGKIDAKYIVGIIPNINGANKDLTLPISYVNKAQQISMNKKDYVAPKPNDFMQMVRDLSEMFKDTDKLKVRESIFKTIVRKFEDIRHDLIEEKKIRDRNKLNTAQVYKDDYRL